MNTREIKGLEIAARMRVVREGDAWSVPSQTGPGKYRVDPATPSCTCEDFSLSRKPCKHVYAVRFVVERESGNEAAIPAAESSAVPHTKRPTYSQDWPAYVRAQTTEKPRFLTLLADLCRGVVDPPRAKTGRKPVSLADRVFVCCFKVYSGFSARRFNTDLEDAHAAGHVSRDLHPHKISTFMESESLSPVLASLVVESSKPLSTVELDFAPDSSAFSTTKYVRWFDVKHGKVRSEHQWVKVQIMTGVRTNVVTAVEVCEQDGPDSPYLPSLVGTTADNFTIREVSADKGYSSVYGHDAVAAAGGTPFIAFKESATGGSGGLWAKMFHYFQYRREAFLKHYHKRSNVEATFSAIKRKFGDSLRSKTRAAMVNEVLCKVLCHNLSVLIHEQEELGITPEFFSEPGEQEPHIIRFPVARPG